MNPPVPVPPPETVRTVAAWVISSPPPPVFKVKLRSVDTVGPVYCRMPPFANAKLAATLDDWPIPLGRAPFARLATDRMPPLTAVAPVYVLDAVRLKVPLLLLA